MNISFKVVILLLLIFLGFNSKAQDKSQSLEILKKAGETYKTGNYGLLLNYTLKTYNEKVIESYKGVSLRNGNNFYSKIGETEFIQEGTKFLKINHDEKAILYAISNESPSQPILEFNDLVEMFDKVDLLDKGNYFIIKLIAQKPTQLPYHSVSIYINKAEFTIFKEILELAVDVPVRTNTGKESYQPAYIELTIKEQPQLIKNFDHNKFLINNYIQTVNKDATPIASLKNYQFIDTTKN